jgi:diguanylate cyclase (GGDEF)-like protein
MALPNMSDEHMRAALKELEQAAYNHERWSEALFSTLICRLAPDPRDTSCDAHRQCRFGQWYYNSGFAALEGYPGFSEIAAEHRHMHQFAASMLRSSAEGIPITTGEYDRFLNSQKRMRLELATIQQELKDALFSLDPLTGTPSRTSMLTKLREEQEMVRRNIHTCAVAMMDLDHFKSVNDRYGHLAGDKVLIAASRYVLANLRPYDKVFRYGGEEFLICLPDADLKTGSEAIGRLRAGLESLVHEVAGEMPFHVTASFGVALLDPDLPVEQSIDRADKALYAAKASGRNRTVAWDATMQASPVAALSAG